MLLSQMVQDGTLIQLNQALRPNSYLARSDPTDVARLESSTYVCTQTRDLAGPTNNWVDPIEMRATLTAMMEGCMQGRRMYVVPFVMGPLGDPWSLYGIQLTDSPYVAVSMSIMTLMGQAVLDFMHRSGELLTWVKCVHSVVGQGDGWLGTDGQPLSLKWPSNARKYIVNFPETLEIVSLGSGYGGNSLLAKKAVALRMASYVGQYQDPQHPWSAEHMLLIGVSCRGSEPMYLTGSFPSACGKTNLALIDGQDPEWTVTTLGDDIVWLHPGEDGRLYGLNPERGFLEWRQALHGKPIPTVCAPLTATPSSLMLG